MEFDLATERDFSDLEKNLQNIITYIKTKKVKSSLSSSIKEKIQVASSALRDLCSEIEIEKDIEDAHIDEFSDHDDDDWANVDGFDDMDDVVKACEEIENSFEEPSSSSSKDINLDEENEKVLPSDEKAFDCEPPSEKHLAILKQFFGHTSFRPMQWKIIRSIIIDHADICAVMATGYGKSLCYQFPAVYTKKPAIVISPLISLMEDQVMALNVANIGACYLGSSQMQTSKVKKEIFEGKHRVIYVTPEFAEGSHDFFKSIYSKTGITLFAIDEAHCVSQWGHDFRNSYRKLGNLRALFPQVPFLAVTATATPTVLKDICNSLDLKSPLSVVSSFDRPNLYLEVCMKSNSIENDLLRVMTKKNRYPCFSGPTIIYCPTRNSTEDVYKRLCEMNVSCRLYHAGMSMNDRKDAHHLFVHDKIQVVVATVAFGMGIDKPDVRRVIHYGAPKDIESYYQEIGRAGRDGSPSICQVFYSNSDFCVSKFHLKSVKSEQFQQHKADMISKMQQYLNATRCRRKMLLSHFQGEDVSNCGGFEKCCDNCKKKIKRAQLSQVNGSSQQSNDDKKDFTEEAKLLFGAIEATGQFYGITVPILLLRGSAGQKITDGMKKCPLYGKGKQKSENWWKAFGRILLCEKYLIENRKSFNSGFATTVGLSPKAKTWLQKSKRTPEDCEPLILEMSSELMSIEEPKTTVVMRNDKFTAPAAAPVRKIICMPVDTTLEEDIVNDETKLDPHEEELKGKLFKELMALRNTIADNEGIAPYMVLSNKNLLDIAVHRPVSLKTLAQVEGITAARISKFGQQVVDFVASYCKKNDFEADSFSTVKESKKVIIDLDPRVGNLKASAQETYKKYVIEEKSVNDIATERNLSFNTIHGHLVEALQEGLPVKFKDLGVTKDIFDIISNVIRSPPINSDVSKLTPIKQLCPEYVDFNHIKVVIVALKHKYGFDEVPYAKEEEKSPSDVSTSSNDVKKTNFSSDTNASSQVFKQKFDAQDTNLSTAKRFKANKLFKL